MSPFLAGARILVLGYGNPARGDDGLGPALIERLRGRVPKNVTLDSDYQLNIENAEAAARHDVVIFCDAAAEGPDPFSFTELEPREGTRFTSHSVSPEGVLHLARSCFGASPRGFLLGIRGRDYEAFEEHLTAEAAANLEAAAAFLEERLGGHG